MPVSVMVLMVAAFALVFVTVTGFAALAKMKNPKSVAFVQQANFANGPQQVNNAVQEPVARAEETTFTPNKQLEQSHGERLDFRKASQAVGSDPAMAAVGAIDGTTHG